jgi:hypothetical protein
MLGARKEVKIKFNGLLGSLFTASKQKRSIGFLKDKYCFINTSSVTLPCKEDKLSCLEAKSEKSEIEEDLNPENDFRICG